MADHPACTVVFEACGSASHWAREMARLGHDARLIAPQYVRPFVKRQKNDSADAEAIVIAARQPEMPLWRPSRSSSSPVRRCSAAGSDWFISDRGCERAEGAAYEHGHVFSTGLRHLERMTALVEDETSDLPALIREEGRDLAAQIAEKTDRIDAKTKALKDRDRYGAPSADHAGCRASDSRGG